ncbi:PilX N-terminal domain-containing pilus assembly protein [Planctomycetota bacterium]
MPTVRFTSTPPRPDGIVLIVVLGVLALLSVLAITFVSMTRLERSISRNYVDRTRAVLAAESGLEFAIAQLQNFSGGILHPDEYGRMLYNPDDPAAALDLASKPSFKSEIPGPGGRAISGVTGDSYLPNGDFFVLKVEDESGKLNLNDSNNPFDPDDEDSDSRLSFIIGNLMKIIYRGEYDDPTMSMKITSVLAEIPEARKQAGGKFNSLAQIARMLTNAGITGDTPAETKDLQSRFLNNITLWSWRDPDVIKPNPRERSYNDPADPRYINPDVKEEMMDPEQGYGIPFMRWEEVQSAGYELEPRSPVNINTASPELLEALLSGIKGWSIVEGPAEIYSSASHYSKTNYNSIQATNFRYEQRSRDELCNILQSGGPMGDMQAFPDAALITSKLNANRAPFMELLDLPYGRLRLTEITQEMARWLAVDIFERIHAEDVSGNGQAPANPNHFDNWREFKFYLDKVIERARINSIGELEIEDLFQTTEALGPTDAYGMAKSWGYDRTDDFTYFNEWHRDLILANFDPNTLSNDFNPDSVAYRLTDKADLECYTTEFSFEPTGSFSIQSRGKISDTRGGILATADVQAVVKVFELQRLTTQKDLMAGVDNGNFEEHMGSNQTAITTKWNSMVCGYPEAVRGEAGDPDFSALRDAAFDGRIGLAPVKHERVQLFASLWSYFEGNDDAFDGMGSVPRQSYSQPSTDYGNKYGSYPVEEEFSSEPLMVKIKPESSSNPGTLYPDGVWCEAWKTLAYPPEDHITPRQEWNPGTGKQVLNKGSFAISIKPNFQPEHGNRTRSFFYLGQGLPASYSNLSPDLAKGWFLNPPQFVLMYFPHRQDITEENARTLCEVVQYGARVWFNIPPPNANSGSYWVPTRSVGWMWGASVNDCGGIPSTLANEVGIDPLLTDQYSFDGRRWNLLAGSWFQEIIWPYPFNGTHEIKLTINGKIVPETRKIVGGLSLPSSSLIGVHRPGWAFSRPVRFGAWSRTSPNIDRYTIHDPADATFGEIFVMLEDQEDMVHFQSDWDEGFYSNGTGSDTPCFTTSPLDLDTRRSNKVNTIRSISWTCRWPDKVRSWNAAPNSNPDPAWSCPDFVRPPWMDASDMPENWDPFTVDIKTNIGQPDEAWFYSETVGHTPPETDLSYSGGSVPVHPDGQRLQTTTPVQLRFYFNLADAEDQVEPLRESPYLDDITITWYPPGGAKILWYQMR